MKKLVKLFDKTGNELVTDNIENITKSQLILTDTKCADITANQLRKQGKTVILDFEAYATNFTNGYNLIGTIPTKYLPQQSNYYTDVLFYFNCVVSGMCSTVFGRITNTGNVEIYSDTSDTTTKIGYMPTNKQFRIHEAWFAN